MSTCSPICGDGLLLVMRLAMMETIQMEMDVFSLLILMHAKETSQDGVVQEETRHLQQYVRQFVETELLVGDETCDDGNDLDGKGCL